MFSFIISVVTIIQLSKFLQEYKHIPENAENDLQKNINKSLRYAKIALISSAILGLSLYLTNVLPRYYTYL